MRFLLPAFLAAVQGLYASQGPAESAAEFVKKLGTGPVDLSPSADTAIVSEISPNKKNTILKRLQRLAQDIKGNEVQVGPTRTEGSLAGVILRLVDPANPSNAQVLAMAMVQDAGTWRAAPVPASFENTTVIHSRASREMASQLEAWLARERVNEVERIRSSAENLLRESLAKAVDPKTVRSWKEEQAVAAFLDACARRDTTRILALLGGLSSPPPDGWEPAAAAVRAAIATPAPAADAWTLLTSPAVLRSDPKRVESASGQPVKYHVLCMDPRTHDKDPALYMQAILVESYSDGLWSVRPGSEPAVVEQGSAPSQAEQIFTTKHPLRPLSSAVELKNALLASIRSADNPYACLDFLHRDNQAESDYPRYAQAVRLCWQTINPATPMLPLELGFIETDNHAYLAMQWLSLGRLGFSNTLFHFQKTKEGWVWNSAPSDAQAAAAEVWVKLNEPSWKKTSLRMAVQGCLPPDFSLPVPTEADANRLLRDWLDSLASADWKKSLTLCAQLGTEKSPSELLRNLGFECRSARQVGSKPIPELVGSGKALTLMATRSTDEKRALLTLLPVVSTPVGPKILLEIDLGDPSRPGRAFLNRNALERLQAVHPQVADELKGMLSRIK